MRFALRHLPLAAMLTLAACATALPTEPGILALPGSGKSLEQFQTDDVECRKYAGSRIEVGGGRPDDASSYDVQRRYDFAYVQCMYSKGHKVPVSGGYTGTSAGNMPPSGNVAPPGTPGPANVPPPGSAPPAPNIPPPPGAPAVAPQVSEEPAKP
jgi:hypothetical protein